MASYAFVYLQRYIKYEWYQLARKYNKKDWLYITEGEAIHWFWLIHLKKWFHLKWWFKKKWSPIRYYLSKL